MRNANGFSFGGQHSRDFGLLVEKRPSQHGPERKRTPIPVLGRNGDLHYDEGAFTNYQQTYVCGFAGDRPVPEMAHTIKNWLYAGDGAQLRLEDEYDPDYFRLATFSGPLDIENQLNKIGKCEIVFDCAPQSFLKSGEEPVVIENAGKLYNPTNFIAKPIITLYGAVEAVLILGETMLHIKEPIDLIHLDCDSMNAYACDENGDQVNKNGIVYSYYGKFPELKPGVNVVTWTGNLDKVEITPRWWTL